MPRLIFGLLLGALLVGGGGALWLHGDPCLGRCGEGTRCQAGRCMPGAPIASSSERPSRRRHHHSSGLGGAPAVTLRPGDERMVAEGDALGRAQHVDLSQPGEDGRQLEQEDFDQIFKPSESQISRCITDALGDAPLESGRVEVGFRVEHDGRVSRVRVVGPQLLQRQGLTRCVRPIVSGLRFPASGGANVVTYPFQLQ